MGQNQSQRDSEHSTWTAHTELIRLQKVGKGKCNKYKYKEWPSSEDMDSMVPSSCSDETECSLS